MQFCCLATTLAQFDGPVPPRPINIPGAIPLPLLRPHQGGRALPGPTIKVRRPVRPQLVIPDARFLDDARPVTEEAEDEPQQFIPQQQHQPAPPAPPRSLFTSEPNEAFQQQEIPSNAQRFNVERPRPVQQVQQQRNLPQPQQPQRPRAQVYQDEPRPHQKQQAHHSDDKPKKPVAQILRKYREENPDGSIVWGFENDDGSYKEETIGIDCVTRGRYGYVDVDTGEKREYSYETGILCKFQFVFPFKL